LRLLTSSFAEAMGFSARRAVKGNEQGIRACGSIAVTRVPLPFSRPVQTSLARTALVPSQPAW
jgi:hypothetical protein